MLHILIDQHHLLIKVAAPETVAQLSPLLDQGMKGKSAAPIPLGHSLQDIICVYAPQQQSRFI